MPVECSFLGACLAPVPRAHWSDALRALCRQTARIPRPWPSLTSPRRAPTFPSVSSPHCPRCLSKRSAMPSQQQIRFSSPPADASSHGRSLPPLWPPPWRALADLRSGRLVAVEPLGGRALTAKRSYGTFSRKVGRELDVGAGVHARLGAELAGLQADAADGGGAEGSEAHEAKLARRRRKLEKRVAKVSATGRVRSQTLCGTSLLTAAAG